MATYEYTALEPNQCRLMQLAPGHGAEPLECKMISFDLAAKQLEYAALSYCWGDPVLSETLHAPNQLPITVSLSNALRRIRRATESIYIWADGACINQSNLTERNHQVLLMRRIYRGASEVIVYLGEEAEHSDLIPLLIEPSDGTKRLPESCSYLNRKSAILARQKPSTRHLTIAWRAFLRRPWFTRLWVIQEVALASRAVAICGAWAVELSNLLHLVYRYHARDYEADAPMRLRTFQGGRNLMMMDRLVDLARAGDPVDMLWLLSRTRRVLVTNQVDYIWGIMGLWDWEKGSALAPDYGQTLPETLKRLAKFFIDDGRGMEMLYYAHVDSWRDTVPTWIPGWATHDDSEYSPFWDISRSPGLGSSGASDMHLSCDGNVLSVKGHQIGIIDEVGDSQRRLLDRINSNPQESFESPLVHWLSTVDAMLISLHEKDPQALAVMKWSTLVLGAPEYELFMSKTKSMSDEERHSLLTKPISKSKELNHGPWPVGEYVREAIRIGQSLRLARSSSTCLCQVPYGSQKSDFLVLLDGSTVPFVIRRLAGTPLQEDYQVVGPCFVYGFMGASQTSKMLVDPFVRSFDLV